MSPFNEFKVLDRLYVLGRGFITVIYNKQNIPINGDSVILQDDKQIPVIGVEKTKTLMTDPQPKPEWGIVTNEETVGDTILIWNKI